MGSSITMARRNPDFRAAPARLSALALSLALVLLPALAPPAQAKWRGIAEADSQIVFAGRDFDAYRASHRYLPFAERAHQMEGYLATWMAPSRRVPVFWTRLDILAPGYYFDSSWSRAIEEFPKLFVWFKPLDVTPGETGKAKTVLGEADYLVFAAGKYRCAAFRLYIDGAWAGSPHSAGNTRMFGLYCPVAGGVDGAAVESVLAKIGIREVAVPEAEPREAGTPPERDLARLVRTGDIRGLRKAAIGGLDPDTVIRFSHPSFAGGREIDRPMLVAAALFGHTEVVVFLLEKGASTRGPGAGAICAAVATDRAGVVDALLENNPGLGEYGRCGRHRTLSPFALAMRLGHLDIAEALRKAGG